MKSFNKFFWKCLDIPKNSILDYQVHFFFRNLIITKRIKKLWSLKQNPYFSEHPLFICITRRVVDNRAARSNRACAIRRNHIIFKTAHWSRIDRALIAHWSRIDYAWSRIDYAWSRIDRALIAHFWSRLITPDRALITPDRALITPDRALIAHWSRIDRAWSRIDRALMNERGGFKEIQGYSKTSLRRTPHKTDTSIRRTLFSVPNRLLQCKMTSIRRTPL